MGSDPFIKNFPDNWPVSTLGELAATSGGGIQTGPFGSQLHADDYVSNGIPSIMPRNISVDGVLREGIAQISTDDAERLSKYRVKKGDIIYSRRGDVEKCARITASEEGWLCGTGCLRLRVLPDVLSTEYLHAYLCHPAVREWISRHAVGATMPNLNTRILSSLPVAIPPRTTMEFISSLWKASSEKIQLNHRINQTLEQISQALFKSWFVDLEPVKAKMAALESGGTAEDAERAAMQAISGKCETELETLRSQNPDQYDNLAQTAALFPSVMVESELGEIPEGWRISKIGTEVDAVGGGTPPTKNPEFWEGGTVNWTSPKDLAGSQDKVLISTERKITEAGLKKISSGLLPKNTVLMSSRAPVGYLALAKTELAVNQGYIAMKCRKEVSPEFMIQWCAANMEDIKNRASGTTFSEISKKNFKIIPIVVPDRGLIDAYTAQTRPIYQQVEVLLEQSESLSQLRDTLLPKLLSGELTIPEAEEKTSETADV